jgi:hypothetical protein
VPVVPIAEVGLTNSDTINSWRLTTNTMVDRWNALGTASAIDITGGTIDGTAIGQSAPQAGTFTNLAVNTTCDLHAATIVLEDGQLSGDWVAGGTILGVAVELSNTTPTLSSHAASKIYVDTSVASVANSLTAYTPTSGYASVAFSGAYSSLSGLPSLGALSPLNTVTTPYITNNAVTYGKIQSISTPYSILGNNTSGAGAVTELSASAASLTFLSQSTTALMATNIGVGTGNTVQHSSLGLGTTAPAAGNLSVSKTASFVSEINNGTVSSNFNIDFTQGQKQVVTLAAFSLTMTFTPPAGPCHVQLRIVQDGNGSRTITAWPTIKTPGGGSSTWALSITPNATDILNLYWNGSAWFGQLSLAWS